MPQVKTSIHVWIGKGDQKLAFPVNGRIIMHEHDCKLTNPAFAMRNWRKIKNQYWREPINIYIHVSYKLSIIIWSVGINFISYYQLLHRYQTNLIYFTK